MLKSLDVLIGISLVMLLVSMVVTVLTQFLTTLINSHGRNLKTGLESLISHLDPVLTKSLSAQIATAVLKHPLIGGAPIIPVFGIRLGSVIHRDELTRILLELASPGSWIELEEGARSALKQALRANGIENVDSTLDQIRSFALALEESHPALASNVRADLAILQAAKSKFVGKINGWFDPTIDRVSERFTMSVRGITFACALLVAIAIQLDAIHILNTLWTNELLTQSLVAEAESVQKQNPSTDTNRINFDQQALQRLTDLAGQGLIVIPWDHSGSATTEKAKSYLGEIPGILLSTFLLSLGAPFWYNSLKTLLQMRSTIADKDDAQRSARQSEGVTGPPPPQV